MKELVTKLNGLMDEWKTDAQLQTDNGVKAVGVRARKKSLEIIAALKEFRKVSLEAAK